MQIWILFIKFMYIIFIFFYDGSYTNPFSGVISVSKGNERIFEKLIKSLIFKVF